ncbi:MAG: class I SAM-dependent methyltransferase [Candidatus Marinimicrobia bacterium]|nr:class I SAM-dependent methyltransferase [Candidatus Neomarinimicrobiota bacterium]
MSDREYIACPYCDADDYALWAEENGWQAVKCRQCDIVYVNPRPTLESIREAARTGLHQNDFGTLDVVGKFSRKKSRKIKRRLLHLYPGADLRGKTIRWLDIGAGFGELLIVIQGLLRHDATVCGVEPCEPKRVHGQQAGLRIEESFSMIEGKFDVISLINVFGHLPNHFEFFGELLKQLTPGGEIVLVTGNGGEVPLEQYPQKLFLPDHLVFAGEKHLSGMLEKLGFDIIEIKRYRVIPLAKMIRRSIKRLFGRRTGKLSPYEQYRSPFRSIWIRARLATDV